MSAASLCSPELTREAVKARFDAALRSGYSAWLWPDVDKERWENALREIASVTRDLLQGDSEAYFDTDDAAAAGIAAYTSGMGPLLGCWIEAGRLRTSPELREMLLLHLRHNRERMALLASYTTDIAEKLAAANIRAVILKGMHTAFSYFPEAGARPVSDIDIRIDMTAMPTAEEILAQLGYQRKLRMLSPYCCDWSFAFLRTEPRTLDLVHQDDFWSIDVQASLNRRLLTGRQIELDRLFSPSAIISWPKSDHAGALRQPLLALHLAVHTSHFLINAALVRIVELILVIRKDTESGALDWRAFLEGASRIGGARYVYPALQFCERMVPGTIPEHVLESCRRDAPQNLRKVVADLSIHAAQPLQRYSISERFMWAGTWHEKAHQLLGELALDGRREPIGYTLQSLGRKLWALRRGRYSA